jgi:nucleoside-diphosphate-sugar epimerase
MTIDLRGKSVVVVGGAGFVGMSLVKLLVSLEARVYVLDNFSRDPTKSRLVKGARYSPGNTGDDATHLSTCRTYFREAHAVFNLGASVGGIDYNIENQFDVMEQNVALQLVPLRAANQLGVPYFLQTSSVCVYSPEVQTGTPVKEDAGILGPAQSANKGYALAKRIGEEAALLTENIEKVVIVRPSNVAGPGDYYDRRAHVIPALVNRVVKGTDEALAWYGHKDTVREFIHPFDVAAGMVRALLFGEHKEVYNIGNPNNVIMIANLVEMVNTMTGGDKTIVHLETEGGDPFRASDSSKLMSTGWEPKFNMEKIVEDEINGLRN